MKDMNDPFRQDCLEILADKARSGQISRRRFTQLAVALMGTSALALRGSPALADAKDLVIAEWGGDAGPAYHKAYGAPFEKESGITVKEDGSGPTEGAIEAQFKSGKPTWDILDADPFTAQALGKKGMMRKIDYKIVDKDKMRKGFGWDYAASAYFYSYIIAYDSTRFKDKAPETMADFFDVKKFPGKRAMYKWGAGMWEALLLGDGVPRDKLYPLDMKRANAKLKEFLPNVAAFWGGGAQSQSLLLNGEVSMALVWSTRAKLLDHDSEGSIKFTWNDGLIAPGAFAVMMDNPAGADTAMKFIASAQDPERQIVMFEMLGQGPANPAADALVPKGEERFNPVDPKNFDKQVPLDMGWYEENYSAALKEYLQIISA